MSITIWRAGAVLLAAGALVLPGRASASIPGKGKPLPNIAPLVLTASDVGGRYGAGFKRSFGQVVTNKSVGDAAAAAKTKVTARVYAGHGRITGFVAAYARAAITPSGKTFKAKPGVYLVVNGVSMYRNASGPTWELKLAATQSQSLGGVHIRYTPHPEIGNGGLTATYHEADPAGTGMLYGVIIAFRQGRYTVTLNVASHGPMSLGPALALAKVEAARLRQHP